MTEPETDTCGFELIVPLFGCVNVTHCPLPKGHEGEHEPPRYYNRCTYGGCLSYEGHSDAHWFEESE